MMYSVTSFGFRLISQPGLFLGLTYDLSVYVAPRMSKHYLKQCFIRYFNMQFSKNNVVPMTDKTQSVLEVRTSDFTL